MFCSSVLEENKISRNTKLTRQYIQQDETCRNNSKTTDELQARKTHTHTKQSKAKQQQRPPYKKVKNKNKQQQPPPKKIKTNKTPQQHLTEQ